MNSTDFVHTTGWPISAQNVNLRLGGRAVLVDLNMTLQPKGRTVILGHNGSGKTALLRLLHHIDRPTTGRILWGEQSAPAHHADQAYVPAHATPFRRTVRQNILLALKLNRQQKDDHQSIAKEAMEICQISALADAPARTLSSGETQKMFLARAWALGATTLLLDEPTANLDPASTIAIEDLINELHQKGVQIIIVTHDIAQAKRLADQVLFLHQGKIDQIADAEAFFRAPKSRHARAYLSGQLV